MIHETVIIDPAAEIAEDVEIGPYSVIGADVVIGAGCRIGSHVNIKGATVIGRDNRIYPHASIGEDPQDKKYAGESTRLEIGDGNTIREFVTINRGTTQDLGYTRVGDDNWIMAYAHIAHDCVIADHTILANGTNLAGHVEIHDHAILGGFTKVHQFCRIGAHAFCGMDCGVTRDVPPFVTTSGHPAEPKGINSEGLKRRGYSREQISSVKQAYRILYRSGLRLEEAIVALEEAAQEEPLLELLPTFLKESRRSVVR